MQAQTVHARALPLLPPPSAGRVRDRSNVPPPLMRHSQWGYSGGLDAHAAYPSPPMTTSPTSPKRLQFLDERQRQQHQQQQQQYQYSQSSHQPGQLQHQLHGPGAGYAQSAGSATSQHPAGPAYMATQVLPSPTRPGPHSAGFVSPFSPITPGFVDDLQGRPRAQSIPSFQSGYPGSAYSAPGMMNMSYAASHYAHPGMVHGPLGMSHAAARIPRTGSRRPKPHVTRACVNCKKAHLSCDSHRPCGRCVTTRKEATCVDVEHKKRGRPRIQPERGHVAERTHTAVARGPPPITPPAHLVTADALGLLKSQPTINPERRGSLPALSTAFYSYANLDPRLSGSQSASYDTTSFRFSDSQASPRWRTDDVALIAFANIELRIVKVNDAMQTLFAEKGELRGTDVEELLDGRHHATLRQLQAELREERNRIEPNRLPGIFPNQEEQRAAHDLIEQDIPRITHGFEFDKSDNWTIRLPHQRLENFYCRIRLARHSLFLVVIELRRLLPESSRSSSSYGGMVPAGAELFSPRSHSGASSARHSIVAPPSLSSHHTNAPLVTSPLREHMYSSSSSSSYFPRQPGMTSPPNSSAANPTSNSMQPPPTPASAGLPPLHRSHTAREPRRHEAMSNVQLPPIINSAPTTPLTSSFGDSPFGFGAHQSSSHQPARMSEQLPQGPFSSTRRNSASEDTDEEGSRKRRRLNIGEILDA